MKKRQENRTRTLLLKNMHCSCCIHLVRRVLDIDGVEVGDVRLGRVEVATDPNKVSWKKIETILASCGFEVIRDREKALVEEIKQAVIDLVHHSTYNAMVRNSDFIVSRFNKSYQHLSTVFSRVEKITLEKYIILQRIEKVKELIQSEEFTLSEIAFMMGYSSVQYLSTQFRQITGYSVTDYKALPEKERTGIRLGSVPDYYESENFTQLT